VIVGSRVHLINPSDLSFGVAVMTPRWLYVLAAATGTEWGDPCLVDETHRIDVSTVTSGDVVGIGIHTGNALRGYEIGRQARKVLALRHQLQVLQRANPRCLRLVAADRWLWTWLARSWTGWKTALVIVKPETVLAWPSSGLPLVLDVEESPPSWTTWGFASIAEFDAQSPDRSHKERSEGARP
jgi:hypothetical protein